MSRTIFRLLYSAMKVVKGMWLAEYNTFFCAPKAIKVMKNMHYLRHTYKINNCFFLIENDDVVFLPENTFRITSVFFSSLLVTDDMHLRIINNSLE